MRILLKITLVVCLLLLCASALCEERELTMGVGMQGVYVSDDTTGMSYISTAEKIASVASDGRIRALKSGSAVIYAYRDGQNVETIYLTVMDAPKKLYLEKTQYSMMIGSTMEIPECRAGEDQYLGDPEIYISNRTVIREGNLLKANDIGSAIVTYRAYNDVKVSFTVSVRTKPTKITLSVNELIMAVGEERNLSYTLESTYSYSEVSGKSDNEAVAVWENGLVRAVGYGKARITLTTENGLSASCDVNILPPPDEIIVPGTLFSSVGGKGTITWSIPEGTMGNVSFVSLDPDTVSVTPAGAWTALREGTALISAVTDTGSASAQIECTVYPAIESLRFDADTFTMYAGQVLLFDPEVTPENAYAGSVTFTSSQPHVASVDEKGYVTALTYGTAYIKAKTPQGVSLSLKVVVLKQPEKVTLSSNYLYLERGESEFLGYSFPKNQASTCTFSSMDPSVAAVDELTGEVTAVSGGTTFITVTSLNGKQDRCIVSVPVENTDIIDFEAVFTDCDSNDGILLRAGDEYAFIDSGNHGYGEKALAYLQSRGITHLKYYIGTHAHLDHVGGAVVLLDNLDIDMVIIPHSRVATQIKSCGWTDSEKQAAWSAEYCVMQPGAMIYLGNVRFTCLGPQKVISAAVTDVAENANSLILRADIGEKSILLTGDATGEEMDAVIKAYPEEVVTDLFKNPHHSAVLYDRVVEKLNPEIVVFSTTSLRIPTDRYCSMFGSAKIYITAPRVNSDVTVTCDGQAFTVTTVYEDNRAAWAEANNVN